MAGSIDANNKLKQNSLKDKKDMFCYIQHNTHVPVFVKVVVASGCLAKLSLAQIPFIKYFLKAGVLLKKGRVASTIKFLAVRGDRKRSFFEPVFLKFPP